MAQNIKTQKGFTIIEVVLVLAIAGLIFLMVFIALPALQRSQRDTQRRNDYSMLSTAVTNYIANNNGKLTKLVASGTDAKYRVLPSKTWINAEGTDPNGQPYYLKIYSYDQWESNPTEPSGDDSGTEVFIVTKANCNNQDENGNSVPSEDKSVRAYAIYGYLEGGSTYCQDVGRSNDAADAENGFVTLTTNPNWNANTDINNPDYKAGGESSDSSDT